MSAKDYLSQYRMIKNGIELAEEQRRYFHALATKINVSIDNAPGSTAISDKVGKNAAKIVDLEMEIQDKIAEHIALYSEIQRTISRLPKMQHRQVLEAVYINGYNLMQAAEKIGYSYYQTERYHLEALGIIEKWQSMTNRAIE